ncbi:MAG TPA: hypothetical protein VLM40_22510 [Gemmata sp.]|nr:hypothetical protein [Gemmata sp.]
MQSIRARTKAEASGGRISIVAVASPNTLMASAGELKGHPLLDGLRKAVEQYREQIENDPTR